MDCPSTPAAPSFALTLLYASHTSLFEISNDFTSGSDLPTQVLPDHVLPEGAGPCQAEGLRFLSGFPDGYGACRAGPRASPGAWAFPVSRLLPIRVSGRTGQGPGRARPAEPAPQGVLDAEGRDPIIGRRGTGGCVVVAAGPMGSSGAGAPGCGHPSGWPAARGRGAWGWSARAAGSIRSTATPPGAGARHGGRSRTARGRACSPCLPLRGTGGQGSDVPVAHRVEDAGEQLAGRGDLGDVARLLAAAGDDGVLELVHRGAGRGALDRLDQCPAQRPRALLGDPAADHLGIGLIVPRGQPGP